MLSHAESRGLVFRNDIADRNIDDEPYALMHESLSSGWEKIHAILPSLDLYLRPIGNASRELQMADDWEPERHSVCVEAIHGSAFKRRAAGPGQLPPGQYPYAPENLAEFDWPPEASWEQDLKLA